MEFAILTVFLPVTRHFIFNQISNLSPAETMPWALFALPETRIPRPSSRHLLLNLPQNDEDTLLPQRYTQLIAVDPSQVHNRKLFQQGSSNLLLTPQGSPVPQ
jgi:hypothetical protein